MLVAEMLMSPFFVSGPLPAAPVAAVSGGQVFLQVEVGADGAVDAIETLRWGRAFLAQPPLEAVKEFQVLTSNYAAEFGHASGGIVNTILKSGGSPVSQRSSERVDPKLE